MTFPQIRRERDLRFYTGKQSTAVFKLVFEHLQVKASVMHYWEGGKRQQEMFQDPELKKKNNKETNS